MQNYDKAREALSGLPKKQTKVDAKKEAVKALSSEIRKALEKGYDLKEIVATLKGVGVDLSVSYLKAAFQDKKPPRKTVTSPQPEAVTPQPNNGEKPE